MNPTAKSLLAILVVVVLGSVLWVQVATPAGNPPTAPPRELGPIPVHMRPVTRVSRGRTLEAYGTFEARQRASLGFEVPGRVHGALPGWEPGRPVVAGELLVELDPGDLDLEVQAAGARLRQSQARRLEAELGRTQAARALEHAASQLVLAVREDGRQERLAGEGHVSERSLDQARATRLDAELVHEAAQLQAETAASVEAGARAFEEGLRVELATAERRREKLRLLAPFDGVLRGHPPAVGDLVEPGRVLGELLDPRSLVLVARVPATEVAHLAAGLEARLFPARAPELGEPAPVPAEVSTIDPWVEADTRRVRVELAPFPARTGGGDRAGSLPPGVTAGAFARAEIDLGASPVIWIARREFSWAADGPVAFVCAGPPEAPVAERRVLVFEREDGEGFVLRSGLAPGDLLLVHPLERLSDGAPVSLPPTDAR